jgi:hypothetical protein
MMLDPLRPLLDPQDHVAPYESGALWATAPSDRPQSPSITKSASSIGPPWW